jgi:hypothetical protein
MAKPLVSRCPTRSVIVALDQAIRTEDRDTAWEGFAGNASCERFRELFDTNLTHTAFSTYPGDKNEVILCFDVLNILFTRFVVFPYRTFSGATDAQKKIKKPNDELMPGRLGPDWSCGIEHAHSKHLVISLPLHLELRRAPGEIALPRTR